MKKELLIESVSKSLEEIYDEYSLKGMLAIYMWGSILTPDFNPESSDVDTIAIINERIDLILEDEIRKKLSFKHLDIKKIGFRLLYKSELDTNIGRSWLGTIGDPVILLLDLPTWRWVCGNRFSQKDFDFEVPTITEAIESRRRSLHKRWPDFDSIKPAQVEYFIKHIMRMVHLEQILREKSVYTPFSYSLVKEKSRNQPEEGLVNLCLDLKSKRWNFTEFKKHKGLLVKFGIFNSYP